MRLSSKIVLTFVPAVLVVAAAAQAQLPSDTCGADLSGSDTFPVGGNFTPSGDDFTMTGTGCTEQGNDSVICFTPTSECFVIITCEANTGTQSANVFAGPCSTSPASCMQTTTGAPAILGYSASAGQNICAQCEYSSSGSPASLVVEAVEGDCGPLPVELQSFSVESGD